LKIQPFPIDIACVFAWLKLARRIRNHAQDYENVHGLSSDRALMKRPPGR
jgi:hypothetical protein